MLSFDILNFECKAILQGHNLGKFYIDEENGKKIATIHQFSVTFLHISNPHIEKGLFMIAYVIGLKSLLYGPYLGL